MDIVNDTAYPYWAIFMRSNHHFASEDFVPTGGVLHHFHEIPVHNHFCIAVESRIEIASFLNLDAEDIEIMFIHIICVTDVEQLTVFAGNAHIVTAVPCERVLICETCVFHSGEGTDLAHQCILLGLSCFRHGYHRYVIIFESTVRVHHLVILQVDHAHDHSQENDCRKFHREESEFPHALAGAIIPECRSHRNPIEEECGKEAVQCQEHDYYCQCQCERSSGEERNDIDTEDGLYH